MSFTVTIYQHADAFAPISAQWYTIKPTLHYYHSYLWLHMHLESKKKKSFVKGASFFHLFYFLKRGILIIKYSGKFLPTYSISLLSILTLGFLHCRNQSWQTLEAEIRLFSSLHLKWIWRFIGQSTDLHGCTCMFFQCNTLHITPEITYKHTSEKL